MRLRNEIPKGWTICNLPDFTDIVMGQSPPSTTYNNKKIGLPFFQGKAEFGDIYPEPSKYCDSPKKIAQEGATLLSVRAPVGPTNVAKEKCCIGRGLAAIHPLNDVSPMFVLYLMRSLEPDISKEGTGSTFAAINKQFIENIKIKLPPLNEQKRIVAKIEELFTELDAGITSLHTAQAQLKTYRQSLLKHAFEGKLTAAWREEHEAELEPAAALLQRIQNERQTRYEEELQQWQKRGTANKRKPSPPKDLPPLSPDDLATLPQLPSTWTWEIANNLCLLITNGTTPKADKLSLTAGDVQFLKTHNISFDTQLLFEHNPSFISLQTHKNDLARSVAYSNDVLMNTVGPPLGKVSVIPDIGREFNINQNITLYRTGDGLLPEFLAYFLLSRQAMKWILEKATATAGQYYLNLGNCRALPIPFCTTLEQQQIVEELESKLSTIDQLEQSITTALQQAEALRQSILKKAFAGQLVPQDPHDEPAAHLLARIRAQPVPGKGQPDMH